jgi:hypothetical protein
MRGLGRRGIAHPQHDTVFDDACAPHGAVEGEDDAGVFGVPLQRQHEGVRIHDPRRGRQQRGDALDLGFQRLRLPAGDQLQVLHAVGPGLGLDAAQRVDLAVFGGDDQLAAAAVRHAALGTVGIQRMPARHAQARLPRALWVVDAGVDDLAVA